MNNRAPFPLVLLDAQMPEMDGMALALEIMSTPSLRHCTLIMLSSTGSRIDKAVLKKSGSPFPDEAYRCRGTVCRHGAGADADATERARSRPPTLEPPVNAAAPSFADRRRQSDQPKLALSFIGKLGHSADLAGNGAEALNRLQTARYDVILMDLQMPEMDGVEAVQAIRQAERRQPAGEPTQRIIAMTAHAMKGDRENACSSALRLHCQTHPAGETGGGNYAGRRGSGARLRLSACARAVGQRSGAVQRAGGDVYRRIAWSVEYLASGDRRSDMRRIKRCAHRLKGETLHFAGSPLTPCLQAIEQAAGARDPRRSLSAVAVGAVEPAATRRADRHRGGNMKTKFWLSLGLLVCASSPCPNAAQRFSRWRLAIPGRQPAP